MNYADDKYKTSINLEIKTYEIDIAGHVNNIVYVKWLEDLRYKLFEQILPIDNLLYWNLYPVVTSTNIVYKKQLKLSDKLTGFVWVEDIRHNMMILKFNFVSNDVVCASAEQKCVLLNLKRGIIDKEQLKSLTGVE
jgi:acyl-CoA thioester hydrolase